jgi:uncharacterized protein YceK
MRKLALALLAVSLMSGAATAQSNTKPQCPPGYSAVGTICQDSSSGDVVLPN